MKKQRLENTTEFKGEKIKTFKTDFEIYEYIDEYYGINLKGSFGSNCIFGGDSACEDHYEKSSIKSAYQEWDGTLFWNEQYNEYRIELN